MEEGSRRSETRMVECMDRAVAKGAKQGGQEDKQELKYSGLKERGRDREVVEVVGRARGRLTRTPQTPQASEYGWG